MSLLPNTPFSRLSREELPSGMQKSWEDALALHGDTTFIEVFGHAPEAYDWYLQEFYRKFFYSGRIEKRLVELVRLRLANVHGCAFCNRADTISALDAGLSRAQIDAIDSFESGPFTEREKGALALADVMALTNVRGHVTPALHARLVKHFKEGELVELGVIMAMLCGMAKMIFAFDLVEKSSTCSI